MKYEVCPVCGKKGLRKWREGFFKESCKYCDYKLRFGVLRSPAPAATVTGWRLVEREEILQAGDERWAATEYKWKPISVDVGFTQKDSAPIRRRLTPPAQSVTDALIKAGVELHNIVDDDLAGQKWACENWRKALSEYEKSLAAVRGAGGEGA